MDERFRIRNYQALGANKKILFFCHCLRCDQAHVSHLPHYVIDIFKERAEKVAFVKGADEASHAAERAPVWCSSQSLTPHRAGLCHAGTSLREFFENWEIQ